MSKPKLVFAALGVAALTASGGIVISSASADTVSSAHVIQASGHDQKLATGPAAWAKVSSGGALLAGSGVAGVNKFGRGRYNLAVSFDISNCALTGTINTNGGGDPGPGSSSILVGAVNSTTLFVRTATPSGPSPTNVDDDRPFSLAIFCN